MSFLVTTRKLKALVKQWLFRAQKGDFSGGLCSLKALVKTIHK
jgi:hypothetical protein